MAFPNTLHEFYTYISVLLFLLFIKRRRDEFTIPLALCVVLQKYTEETVHIAYSSLQNWGFEIVNISWEKHFILIAQLIPAATPLHFESAIFHFSLYEIFYLYSCSL